MRDRIALRHSYCDILLMLSAVHGGKDFDIFPKRELPQGSPHADLDTQSSSGLFSVCSRSELSERRDIGLRSGYSDRPSLASLLPPPQ
jgi:hypothetical protein